MSNEGFWVLGALAILAVLIQSGAAIWHAENRRFARRRRDEACPFSAQKQKASVIVVCNGFCRGLRENLQSYLRQDYANYELLLAVNEDDRESIALVNNLISENRFANIKLVRAGVSEFRSQRMELVRAGIAASSNDSSIFVVSNGECHSKPTFLRWMVNSLEDCNTGLATGGTWYFPRYQNVANRLMACLGNILAGYQGPKRQLIVSSDAWAIRRNDFVGTGLYEAFATVVDERWILADAITKFGLKIRFEPQCLVTRTVDCNLKTVWRENLIQNVIGKKYWFPYWLGCVAVMSIVQLAYWATLFAMITSLGESFFFAATWGVANGLIYFPGVTKNLLKNQIGKLQIPGWRLLRSTRNTDVFAWPLIDLYLLVNMIASTIVNRVTLNSTRYEIDSKGSVRVLSNLRTHRATSVFSESADSEVTHDHSRAA